MWYSIYELLPSATTIVAVDPDDEVRGTITVVRDSRHGLPDDELYGEELGALRPEGCRLAEIISLGMDPDVHGSVRLMTRLFNIAFLVARGVMAASDVVTTPILQAHTTYYRRCIFFERVGKRRAQKKIDTSVDLLRLNLAEAEHNIDRARADTITGGCSGIGKAYAEALVRLNVNVVIASDQPERLEYTRKELSGLSSAQVETLLADLSGGTYYESVPRLMAGRDFRILISNASYGNCGVFWQQDLDTLDNMMRVNTRPYVTLPHLFINDFLEKDSSVLIQEAPSR